MNTREKWTLRALESVSEEERDLIVSCSKWGSLVRISHNNRHGLWLWSVYADSNPALRLTSGRTLEIVHGFCERMGWKIQEIQIPLDSPEVT